MKSSRLLWPKSKRKEKKILNFCKIYEKVEDRLEFQSVFYFLIYPNILNIKEKKGEKYMFYVKDKETGKRVQVFSVAYESALGLGDLTLFLVWDGKWVWVNAERYVKD